MEYTLGEQKNGSVAKMYQQVYEDRKGGRLTELLCTKIKI